MKISTYVLVVGGVWALLVAAVIAVIGTTATAWIAAPVITTLLYRAIKADLSCQRYEEAIVCTCVFGCFALFVGSILYFDEHVVYTAEIYLLTWYIALMAPLFFTAGHIMIRRFNQLLVLIAETIDEIRSRRPPTK